MSDPNLHQNKSGAARAGRIQILMCTHNGAAHLAEQLQSFLNQTHEDWALWVRDDRSTDATLEILTAFQEAHPERDVRLLAGGGEGSAINFVSLLAHPDLPPGPVALADQDDVWLPHKLERAMAELARVDTCGAIGEQDVPVVYSSRTYLTDAALLGRKPSVIHKRGPGFGNALVQNILAGNTMVLNAKAVSLLRLAAPAALKAPICHHDWWIYLVATAAGARVINDLEPGLLYRQHGQNLMGANRGMGRAIERLTMLTDGRYAEWVSRNLDALQAAPIATAPTEAALLRSFVQLRKSRSGLGRVRDLWRLGVHRQTWTGTLTLYLLALTGRL